MLHQLNYNKPHKIKSYNKLGLDPRHLVHPGHQLHQGLLVGLWQLYLVPLGILDRLETLEHLLHQEHRHLQGVR